MAVAPGGIIRQMIAKDPLGAHEWDTENTVLFNVQFINTASFKQLIGFELPNCLSVQRPTQKIDTLRPIRGTQRNFRTFSSPELGHNRR
jgi:hypothetical protein